MRETQLGLIEGNHSMSVGYGEGAFGKKLNVVCCCWNKVVENTNKSVREY